MDFVAILFFSMTPYKLSEIKIYATVSFFIRFCTNIVVFFNTELNIYLKLKKE